MKTKWFVSTVVIVVMGVFLFFTCGLKLEERTGLQKEENPTMLFASPEMPDSVQFIGENVPLDRFDVFESLERELLVNTYFHSQTIRFIKLAPRYFSIIDPILRMEGIPEDFRYLMVAESNLDPRALSPAGAAGFWQFLKTTAVEYGLEVSAEVDERYNLEKATYAACRYMKNGKLKYGSWALVAAAYNAGYAAIDKQLERQKVNNYFDLLLSEETERYIFRILSLKMVLENPEKYGFQVKENEKYPLLKTYKTELTGPVADFSEFARKYGITYKMFKYYNPWLREISLTNKAGKTYTILLPE
jgi:membrane-bound lytic murein transglycosylase D